MNPDKYLPIEWKLTPAKRDGETPEHLLTVPGFINEVANFTMETAPYPNKTLAFAGALALQALLASRKVRTEGDIRPNLYLLALATSGSGKDWPRKVIKAVLARTCHADAVGDAFASGEGIEDALSRSPAKLYLVDEIDQILKSMASKSQDSTHRGIEGKLLTLYGAGNTTHLMRDKARGGDSPVVGGGIVNPHLSMLGTAIPVQFYESFNARMLTNGLLGRMLVLDASGPRQAGDAKPIEPPDSILSVARWWNRFTPGGGDLALVNPDPLTVPSDTAGRTVLGNFRNELNDKYNSVPEEDETTRSVLARGHELSGKLALLYACSENHLNPLIGISAAMWATGFVRRQIGQMLTMAKKHGSTSDDEKTRLKMLAKMSGSPGRKIAHNELLKTMRMDAKAFRQLITTLIDRGDVDVQTEMTAGRSAVVYVAKK